MTLICLLLLFNLSISQESYQRTLILMGSRFEITVLAQDKISGDQFISLAVNEIQRIERLISSWDPKSQTSAINKNAGIKAVVVNKELFDLIYRSIQISKLTDGAFDISYASMDRIWKFDGTRQTLPSKDEIKHSVRLVDYKNIILNPKKNSVFLKEKGMKIGFGAIGKGYAADKAKSVLIQKGVQSGIINASGDLATWGKQANGKAWTIGLTNPENKTEALGYLLLNNNAVVTSGNYEKFVIIDNVRYSHIINPRTGYPSRGIVSVTVTALKAELADALATSVFIMGLKTGLDRINQIPNVECVIIDDKGKIHSSKNMEIRSL